MANLSDSVGIQIMANLNIAGVQAQIKALQAKSYTLNIGANQKTLQDTNTGVKNLTKNVTGAKTATTGFAYEMKTAIVRTIEWTVAVGGLYKAIRFFTDGIDFINDLNKALTEISVVTGKTREQATALGEDFNEMAINMSQSTQALSEASVIFYRQGKSQAEVMDLLSSTAMASSISNV